MDAVAGEINTSNNGSSGIRVEVTKRPISGSFSYSSIRVSKGNSDYEYPSWSGASSGQDVEYNISPSVSGVTISRSSGKVSVSSSASVMSRSFTITATGTDNYTGSITGSIYVDVSKPYITGSFSYSSIRVSKGNSDYEYPSWSGASSGQDVEYSISPTVSGVTISRSSGKVSVSSSASVMSESFTITATGTGNYTGSITGSIYVDVSKPYITGTLSYNSINIAAGYATSMQPNWSGVTSGQTVEYSISPYKSGITIDKYTGVISVAADTNSGYNDYTVTAEGNKGLPR